MIEDLFNVELTQYEDSPGFITGSVFKLEYCHEDYIGESIESCIHRIEFDQESMYVSAEDVDNNLICSIEFKLTPKFKSLLKSIINGI